LILNTLKTILHLAVDGVKEIIKSNYAPKQCGVNLLFIEV